MPPAIPRGDEPSEREKLGLKAGGDGMQAGIGAKQAGMGGRADGVLLPAPLDLPASLERFRRWGDDHLDSFDGSVLTRVVRFEGAAVALAATPTGSTASPSLDVVAEREDLLPGAVEALVAAFARTPPFLAELSARDPVVAALDARYPGLRPVLETDLFTGAVRAISAQQVNLRWAAVTRGRLALAFGTPYDVAGRRVFSLDPSRIAQVDVSEIRALQFTTAKASAIVRFATAVAEGQLDQAALAHAPDEEVIAATTALHGIGRWTADWLLARTLGRSRVAAGDLGVRKAVGAAYLGGRLPSEHEVRELTAHWGPAAAVVQQLALEWLVEGFPRLGGRPEARPADRHTV